MRTILAIVLMAGATCALAKTKVPMLYDCGKPSGSAVVDLACNIYFEARDQTEMGQYVAALSVRARVLDRHYPDTYSEVVYEKRVHRRTGRLTPMYSWTYDKKRDRIYNYAAWSKALMIAADVVARHDTIFDFTYGCKWYFNPDLANPAWAKSYYPTLKVGDHQCFTDDRAAFEEALEFAVLKR